MSSGDDLADQLRAALGGGQITHLHRLSGGASRETWSFDRRCPDGATEKLILRRESPGGPGDGRTAREIVALAAAEGAGLAVPAVRLAAVDGSLWNAPGLVMTRLDGETRPRHILRDAAYATARSRLVEQLGAFAAGLHAIPPPDGLPVVEPLAEIAARLENVGGAVPVFAAALAWLREHRPAPRAVGLTHGDLRLGNLLVEPDGLQAVLDWELVHLAEPGEDLGWLCVRAWRFGGADAAGVGTRTQLLDAYRAAGGVDLDDTELGWWEVVGTLRWGVGCLEMAQAWRTGATRSIEWAAVGRRAVEQEWDLVLLLAPEAAAEAGARALAATQPGGPPSGLDPTAVELLTGVARFLTDQVRPDLADQLGFHVQVAAGILEQLGRELTSPPGRRRPEATGIAEQAEDVARRLAIVNPSYF